MDTATPVEQWSLGDIWLRAFKISQPNPRVLSIAVSLPNTLGDFAVQDALKERLRAANILPRGNPREEFYEILFSEPKEAISKGKKEAAAIRARLLKATPLQFSTVSHEPEPIGSEVPEHFSVIRHVGSQREILIRSSPAPLFVEIDQWRANTKEATRLTKARFTLRSLEAECRPPRGYSEVPLIISNGIFTTKGRALVITERTPELPAPRRTVPGTSNAKFFK